MLVLPIVASTLVAFHGPARTPPHRAAVGMMTVTADPAVATSIFVDEEAMLKEAAFPIAPEELVASAKRFLLSRGGFGADPELLADTF